MTESGRVALCTHRPVLAGVFGAIATRSEDAAQDRLPDGDPWLAPGGILVAHHVGDTVFWVELH